ncbi:MAG: type I secretion C-terminal target domain-containing protein, partial [Pseudomonadota bacterium]
GGGPASLTIFLETADDSLIEGPENYTLIIEDPSIGEVIAGEGLVTTVIDDNNAGALVWHLSGDQLTSEGESAAYRLSYDGASLAPGSEVSIAIDLNLPGGDGGAESGDFSASLGAAIQAAIAALGPDPGVRFEDGRVIFEGGGPTDLAFDLPVAADGLVEGPENYTMVIDTPSDGTVADGGGLVTTVISDVDGASVSWSLTGDTNATEGGGATYTVRLDNADLADGQEVSVALTLDLPGGPDGAESADLQSGLQTALGAAIDELGPASGLRLDGDRLIFSSAAPRSLSFRLDIADDRLIERTENYRLSLATPSSGTIAATAAAVTTLIADTDASEILWRLGGDQLVTEGGAPNYTIERVGGEIAEGASVSVNLAINLPGGSGGASAADFSSAFYQDIQAAIDGLGPNAGITLAGTTLIFNENADESFTFTLPTADDSLPEGAENYTVTISAPSDGSIDNSNRLVTTAILDNDGPTIVTGTDVGETLTGSDHPDDISGLAGDDTLIGGAGADILRGGAGRDNLLGGSGADRLEGDAGADFFIIDVVDLGSGIDRAVDFRVDEGDSLHVLDLLTGFDQAMVDIDAFIRFQERQEGTVVQIDTDGANGGAQYVDAILLEAVRGVTVDQLMADNNLMVS